jgi:hypothetical protein
LTIMDGRCCTGSQWLGTDTIGAGVVLSKNPRRIYMTMWVDGRTATQ